MVTTASKFFFAGAFVALVASYAYGIGTDGDLVGVLTMGLKGPVGELAGYTILQAAAFVLLALGIASSALRDADPEVQAAVARLESLPEVVAPRAASYWPVLGALSAVVAAVGLVASPVVFVIGLLGVLLVLLEWMVTAWSERATGDPGLNRQIRNRLMYPIEVPLFGALAVLVAVVSISRVFLAIDRVGSSIAAIVIAALVLFGGFLVAYRPRMSKDAIAVLLTVFAVVVIAGGIIGASSGTREFEHHGSEDAGHTDEPGSDTDAGGGPDAGAQEDPSGDNTEGDDRSTEEDPEEEPPGTAEGTDEGQDQGELAPEDEESEG